MAFVPIINHSTHAHLTLADWEALEISHVAIDVVSLFVHPHCLIPSTAKTVFLDTRIRSYHRVSGKKKYSEEFFLHSPHNGQKISITPEGIQAMIKRFFSSRYSVIIIDEKNHSLEYNISDRSGRDAEKGILYSKRAEVISIQDAQWAGIVEPIESQCACYTCKNFTLSYLHHLHQVSVPLGLRLGVIHNLLQLNS